MDPFFTQNCCERCGGSLEGGRIMSMFNTQTICMRCKAAEKENARYRQALEAEMAQVQAGNYNYPGIGY